MVNEEEKLAEEESIPFDIAAEVQAQQPEAQVKNHKMPDHSPLKMSHSRKGLSQFRFHHSDAKGQDFVSLKPYQSTTDFHARKLSPSPTDDEPLRISKVHDVDNIKSPVI